MISDRVSFVSEGAENEKLLNFCIKNGIEIINPTQKGFILSAEIKAGDYKKLRKPSKKYGLKVKMIKKNGFGFFIKRNFEKIGMFFGIITVFLGLTVLNRFIWVIEVSGNEKVSSDEIIVLLSEAGFEKGTLAKKHNIKTTEWFLMNENEDISLAEINITGSIAEVLIRETSEKAKMKYDDDIPINIVASKYGVIRKMNVFDGQKCVQVGDAVMEGDLLVSAVFEDRHNKLTLKHARAEIFAETDYHLTVEFPFEKTVRTKGKINRTVYDIEFLAFDFRLGSHRNTDNLFSEKEERKIRFLWIELPINVIITRYFSVKENSITHSFDNGKAFAYELLEKKENEVFGKGNVISRKVSEKVKNGKYILDAEYVCLLNIAKEQAIESDEPWKNTDDMS